MLSVASPELLVSSPEPVAATRYFFRGRRRRHPDLSHVLRLLRNTANTQGIKSHERPHILLTLGSKNISVTVGTQMPRARAINDSCPNSSANALQLSCSRRSNSQEQTPCGFFNSLSLALQTTQRWSYPYTPLTDPLIPSTLSHSYALGP